MSDYEIDQIRRIRKEVSAQQGHDLRKLAEYYRTIENRLREAGRHRFADDPSPEVRNVDKKNSE